MHEENKLRMQLVGAKTYLDIKDVSLLSNYSISTIRRKIEDGIIKPFQSVPNGKLLFKRSQIESFIENGG